MRQEVTGTQRGRGATARLGVQGEGEEACLVSIGAVREGGPRPAWGCRGRLPWDPGGGGGGLSGLHWGR